MLFALPFFGIGVWMLLSVGSTFVEAWQMNSWVQTEAHLIRGGYETNHDSDSTTYEAFADYEYTIEGRRYEGDRVSLGSGSDNIGSYQEDVGRKLRSAASSDRSIQVFVDPQNPSDSIFDRGVRWGLIGFKSIFLFAFGGIGLGLLIAAWRAPKEKDATLPEYQDAPWLMNDNWQTATIKSSSKNSMWFAWGFAALWNLISVPLPFLLYEEVVEKANYLALVALLFPLVGIGLLVWAVKRTLEWKSFGAAPLSLDPFPGSIGGHVGGTIELGIPFDGNNEFALTLTNVHSYTSGSGKSRSTVEKAVWQKNLIAHATMGTKGTRLTFRFDVPEHCRESDVNKGDSYHLWRLSVGATLTGTNLNRDYELPVYATATQSRLLSSFAVGRSENLQRSADDRAVRELVNLESTGSGKRMLFPIGRNLTSAIGGCLVGAIFAVAGWFIIIEAGEKFFGSVFGGIGALIAIGCLYMMLNSLEVTQTGREIRTVRRLLGIPVGRKSMQREVFKHFRKNSSFQTQSGKKQVMYYSVEAVDRQDNKLVVGVGFKGENEADAAIRLISEEFGLMQAANDPESSDDEFLSI